MLKLKQIRSLALAAGLALAAPSAMAADGDSPAKAPQAAGTPAAASQAAGQETRLRLPNGLSVYILKDTRFPIVCTRLYVRTGSTHEEPAQFGISHVLEHMVFKGTEARPKGQLAKDVEALGGYLNAYTSFDKTCYLTDMPSQHWKTGIDVVRDMAFHPALDPKELESEKTVIISELEGNEDNPERRLYQDLQTASLAGTPYEHLIIGSRDTIRAVTSDSLRAYIDRWYQPQNMLLVVAGNVDPAAVSQYVEQTFSGLKDGSVLPDEKPVDIDALICAPGTERVRVDRGPWNKVYLGVSFAVPGLRDLRSLDFDVLSYLLTGDGTAYFERKYHLEKHLVDSIDVSNSGMNRVGMFTITAVLDAKNVKPFFSSLVKDLSGLKMNVFTEKEMQRAKYNLEDSFDRSAETLNGLASWRALMEFDLGGRQGEENIRTAQRQVNFEHMAAMYARYIRPERMVVRVLAPRDAQLPDLAAELNSLWPVPQTTSHASAAAVENGREIVDLGGGRKVILLPDHTIPYMSMTLAQSGGNALLSPSEAGLDTLTAATLTDGCGGMDRSASEKFLAERAASVSVRAGLQTFVISATSPTRYSGDVFGYITTMMEKPSFSAQEMTREAQDMAASLMQREDNPMALAAAKVPPFLFGSRHPYGMDPLGSMENIRRFTRDDVLSYWKKQKGQPWSLAVCGSFDRDSVLAFAKSLPKPSEKAVTVSAPQWTKEKVLSLPVPKRNKAHLMLIFPTVKRTSPDAPALELLQSVLDGQSGLLFSQLRDVEGLGYTVTAVNRYRPECGFMLFYIGTTPDRVDKAREGFERIIRDVCDKPLPKELLASGVNQIEGSYYRGRQSLSSRSEEAATLSCLGEPLDMEKDIIGKVKTLTPEDVRAVAQKYLKGGYEVKLVP